MNMKNEWQFKNLQDNIKCTIIHSIGVLEEEEKEGWSENIFDDVLDETFPNLGKETDIQVQGAQRDSNRINQRWTHQHSVLLKWKNLKIKRN